MGLAFTRFRMGVRGGGSGSFDIQFLLLYLFSVAYAAPYWAIAFVPLYFTRGEHSVFWRWYAYIPFGAVVGLLGALLLFRGETPKAFVDRGARELFLMPIYIGSITFALGCFFKYLERPSRIGLIRHWSEPTRRSDVASARSVSD
jgi:hypothetical protein